MAGYTEELTVPTALAKAIYYGCDSGAPNSHYHEVWHAIRSMMLNWYQLNAGTWTPATSSLCNDGWLGMARNLLAYLVAADYLNSLGPINSVGSPWPQFNNQQTFDSLKVFTRQIRDRLNDVRAPNTSDCNCDEHLGYMGRPKPSGSDTGYPDNKGASALASYLGAVIFHKNRVADPPAAYAWYDSAARWYKAWFDHSYGHFRDSRYYGGKPGHSWEDSWVQGDYAHPQPVLGFGAADRKWPYPATATHLWTRMSGAIVEDMIRDDPPLIPDRTPSYTATQVDQSPSAALLLVDGHIAGTINYLTNAAELLYQDGKESSDCYGFANDGPSRTVAWFDYYAAVDGAGPPSPHADWKKLREQNDDWPATYVLFKRGYFSIDYGMPGIPSEGKQMSFTDLTHKP